MRDATADALNVLICTVCLERDALEVPSFLVVHSNYAKLERRMVRKVTKLRLKREWFDVDRACHPSVGSTSNPSRNFVGAIRRCALGQREPRPSGSARNGPARENGTPQTVTDPERHTATTR